MRFFVAFSGFYGTCALPPEKRPAIVFERISDGASLEASHYGVHSHLHVIRSLSVALDVARGLSHAHRKGYMHRDVKCSNVLVSEHAGAKICDWGLSVAISEPAKSPRTGTDVYMA